MAVVLLPSIRTTILGDNVTSSDRTTTFTLGEKLENVFYIKQADGNLSVDISKIDNLQTLIFYSTSIFILNLSVDIGSGTPNVVTIPISTTNFRLDPATIFASKITSISISTVSTSNITVYINIYGKA